MKRKKKRIQRNKKILKHFKDIIGFTSCSRMFPNLLLRLIITFERSIIAGIEALRSNHGNEWVFLFLVSKLQGLKHFNVIEEIRR